MSSDQPMEMRRHPSFQHGIATGAASGGTLLLGMYTAAAPTDDIRARIPFLLVGVIPHLTMATVFFLIGMLGLLFTGGRNWRAMIGVAVASAVLVFVLSSELLVGLVPEFSHEWERWTAFIAVAIGGVAELNRRRRHWRKV